MTKGNSIIVSLFWKVGERILVQGLNLLVQIILARLLMPEDFACLAIISTIVNYLGIFVQSGLSIAVVQKKDLTITDISTLATISLLVASIMYVGLYFAAPYIDKFYAVGDIVWPIRVMGLSLFLFAFNSIQTGLLQRQMRFRTIFFRSMLATPISGVIGVTMAYMGYGIWALIAFTLSNATTIVLFMNTIPELRLKLGFSLKSAKELYSFSIKILGTSLVSSGGDTIRTLTIGKYFNTNQLAYFDRGLSYSGLITHVVNTSLSSVMLPVLSRRQDDTDEIKLIVRKSVGLSTFIMVPILIMIAIVSESLVRILLTDKWVPCAIYLSLFCLLRIPGIITSIDKQAYYALGKSQVGLSYEVLLMTANILSLIIMIKHGILAIAVGLVVIEYIGNFALFLVSSKIFKYSIKERFQDMYKQVISSLAMVISMLLISKLCDNDFILVILQILTGLLVYIVMSIIIKDKNLKFLADKLNAKKK